MGNGLVASPPNGEDSNSPYAPPSPSASSSPQSPPSSLRFASGSSSRSLTSIATFFTNLVPSRSSSQLLPPDEYYPIDCLLGEGAYSTVYRGFDFPNEQYIAIKTLHFFSFPSSSIVSSPSPSPQPPPPSSSSHPPSAAAAATTSPSTIPTPTPSTIFSAEKIKKLLLSALTELKVYQRIQSPLGMTVTPTGTATTPDAEMENETEVDTTSPFLIQLFFAYSLPHKGACYLLMSCLSVDLRRILKVYGSFPEHTVIYILGCIGHALHHLHSLGIIHRDIKPENISLDQVGRPYLTDFGISYMSSQSKYLPICNLTSGTLPYQSPEVLSPEHYHSYQADYWGLGVTGYELLYNRHPFHKLCPSNMIKFVANNYSWIWRELLSKSSASSSSSFPFSPSSASSSSWSQPLLKTNFETIQHTNPGTELPFPDYNEHVNDDEEGSLPLSLLPIIPGPREFCGVSREAKSLLTGLMDVRLPLRLGNLHRYRQFAEHEAFAKYGYTASQLPDVTSPMAGAGYLNRIPSHQNQQLKIPSPPKEFDHQVKKEIYTPEIKQLLTEFQYPVLPAHIAPSDSRNWQEEIAESIRSRFLL